MDENYRVPLRALDSAIRGGGAKLDPQTQPPDALNIVKIGELSARGIDKICVETADQIRDIGQAAVTRAKIIEAEANALADNILAEGRKFADRVAAFTSTADSMMNVMNEQRARLTKSDQEG